jgi:hypothetical protein
MNKRILTILSMGIFLLTIYAAVAGNETILPPALVFLLLGLIGLISPTPSITKETNNSASEKAARYAMISFAVVVAVLSVLVSLFLPGIAGTYGLTGLFDGDFVRVSINDAHELAYSTCLLLVLDILFLARQRGKQNQVLRADGHARINQSV